MAEFVKKNNKRNNNRNYTSVYEYEEGESL